MSNALEILQKYWGHSAFRELQEDIINSVLSAKDTIALLPTGGGKSVCYQVPGMMLNGTCIVISPLVALMQDQVSRLQSLGIAAETLHSGLHYTIRDSILNKLSLERLKFLYISPESLRNKKYIGLLKSAKISFVAIDEAHCISQWGYDFRPSYLLIHEFRDLVQVPFLALTATATASVLLDIHVELKLINPIIFKSSFSRPNIQFVVEEQENKMQRSARILHRLNEAGIIYTRNRKNTLHYSDYLIKKEINASAYHAGMESDIRKKILNTWLSSNNDVVVCTNAFGMGIDKADVRSVIHVDLPTSIEEYYQEAGRAGRDGNISYAILLYDQSDILRFSNQFEKLFPSIDFIRQTYKSLAIFLDVAVGSQTYEWIDFDLIAFCNQFNLPLEACYYSMKVLEQSDLIDVTDSFMQSSKLQIIANQEALRSYMILNEEFQQILLFIQRAYEGIHTLPVNISEDQISKTLNWNVQKVKNYLIYFQKENLIKYHVQKTTSQVKFIGERLRSNEIIIDQDWYQRRKQVYLNKLQGILNYINEKNCRQQNILNYFGEVDTLLCGRCDLCLARIVPINRKAEILSLLKHRSEITLLSLIEFFPYNVRSHIIGIVEDLIREGLLIRKLDRLIYNTPN